MPDEILTLTEAEFPQTLEILVARDADLAKVIENYGNPPFFRRAPGFQTLIHIILEQQVSLASAKAAFERTKQKLGADFDAREFLKLSDEELKSLGFSRQKTVYSRGLANAVASGALDLERLEKLPDDAVKNELVKLKGIGRWTADIYLLMCLLRTDAFPVGDLGLIVGAQTIKGLHERPTTEKLEQIAAAWRPFRAVATRIVWHYYLKEIRPYNGY